MRSRCCWRRLLCSVRTKFWRCPGRWWCGWRIWCDGRACSRRVGAAAPRRRPAGPTASTGPCRPRLTAAAAVWASCSKTRQRVRKGSTRSVCCWRSRSRLGTLTVSVCQMTWWGPTVSKCSATRSTAAFAPCRGASWTARGPRGCRIPTCWPWGVSKLCPTPGWCTAGTRSATRRWRAAQSSPGSSVSAVQSEE